MARWVQVQVQVHLGEQQKAPHRLLVRHTTARDSFVPRILSQRAVIAFSVSIRQHTATITDIIQRNDASQGGKYL